MYLPVEPGRLIGSRKIEDALYTAQISSLSHGGPILGFVTQQFTNKSGLMQSLVACWVASLAFLKPSFEIQAFCDALGFS